MTGEFAALDDDAFRYTWSEMSPEARLALPGAVRAEAVERYRKLTPWVADTVRRAQREMDAKDAKQKPKVPQSHIPRTWLDDAQMPPRTRGPVKGVIGPGDLGVLYGESGGGKTAVAIGLAGHVAMGIPWRGLRTTRSLVVYVAAEAGSSILRRFIAWRDRHVHDTHDVRVPLSVVTRGVNLMFPVEVEELVVELRAATAEVDAPLGLVVFDTLSRSIPGGDENAASDMTKVIAVADRIRDELGAATLVVHHCGKSGNGARGHSSLVAAADVVLEVRDHVVTVEKVRDGVAGQTFPFKLEVVDLGVDEDGDTLTTCIALATDAARPAPRDREQRLTGVAKVALQALREAIDEHGETLPQTTSIPHVTRAVTLIRWRDRFAMRYGSDERGAEAIRKAFGRGKEHLLKCSAIGISDPYVWASR